MGPIKKALQPSFALLVLLSGPSCDKAANRPDSGAATGGMSGTGGVAGTAPGSGSGGSGVGGGSAGATAAVGVGGSTAGGGAGGVTSVGGSGGTGGDSISDGGSVDVGSDTGSSLEPIHVSEAQTDAGAAAAYKNLRIVGEALDDYEGDVVTFRIGSGSGVWRFGSGQVRIVQGTFDVTFTGVLHAGYYQKIVHIDADGSGTCEVGEPMFLDAGLYTMDTTLTVKPTAVQFRSAPSGPCAVVNAPPPY